MAAPAPHVTKLLALGEPITLATGVQVRIRYSMLGMARLEQRFGSLTAVMDALTDAQKRSSGYKGEDAPGPGPGIFELLPELIQPGLIGQVIDDPFDDLNGVARIDLGDPANLGTLSHLLDLDGDSVRSYVGGFEAAFRQAMPEGDPPKAGQATAPKPASRTRTSGTSQSRGTASPKVTSGT